MTEIWLINIALGAAILWLWWFARAWHRLSYARRANFLAVLGHGEMDSVRLYDRLDRRLFRSFVQFYVVGAQLEAAGLVETRQADPTPERGGRAKMYWKVKAKT